MQISVRALRSLIQEAYEKAYNILGLTPNATPAELKKAYLTKVIALHPDRNQGKDTGPDMVKVNVAYGILSDPAKRRDYDSRGDKTIGDFAAAPSWKASASSWKDSWKSRHPEDPDPWGRDASKREPPKPPPPQPKASSGWGAHADDTPYVREFKYYTNTTGRARKYWWIEKNGQTVTTGWGRMGSPGQQKSKVFSGSGAYKIHSYVRNYIISKINKGYVRVHDMNSREKATSWNGTPYTKPKQQAPSSSTPRTGSKKDYKIYGQRGRVVTRYKSKLYVGKPGSKFKPNQRAEVTPGKGETVNVRDTASGHTQGWDYERESLERMISDIINEELSK